jgi:hypothetical protein
MARGGQRAFLRWFLNGNASRRSNVSWRSRLTLNSTMLTVSEAWRRANPKLAARTRSAWLSRSLGVADILCVKALVFPLNQRYDSAVSLPRFDARHRRAVQ